MADEWNLENVEGLPEKNAGLTPVLPDKLRKGTKLHKELTEIGEKELKKKKLHGRASVGGVMTEPLLFKPLVKHQVLPAPAKRIHGCLSCEWRGTPLCPFGFKKGRGFLKQEKFHVDGICKQRENYLLNVAGVMKAHPTFSEWQHGFTKNMAHMVNNEDFMKLKEKELEIETFSKKMELKKVHDPKAYKEEYDRLSNELMVLRVHWQGLWRDLMRFSEEQMARETAKNPVINVNTIQLSQIQKIMRGADDKKFIEDFKKDQVDE